MLGNSITGKGCTVLARSGGHFVDVKVPPMQLKFDNTLPSMPCFFITKMLTLYLL